MPVARRSPIMILTALALALLVPVFGWIYLGPLYAVLFLIGYGGGFLLWCVVPSNATWLSIRTPYWLTMAAFLGLHKLEENRMKFFEEMSSKITRTPMPEVSIGLVLTLLVFPIGAWLLVAPMMKHHSEWGRLLAWTFFASMGLTELAHFFLPLLAPGPYGYFPGMASVVVLAPLAWWGMWRLAQRHQGVGRQA
jgi:hypothetical protein